MLKTGRRDQTSPAGGRGAAVVRSLIRWKVIRCGAEGFWLNQLSQIPAQTGRRRGTWPKNCSEEAEPAVVKETVQSVGPQTLAKSFLDEMTAPKVSSLEQD